MCGECVSMGGVVLACHLLHVIWQSFQGLETIGVRMDKKLFIPVLEVGEKWVAFKLS